MKKINKWLFVVGYVYLVSGGSDPKGFLSSAAGGFAAGAIFPARGISSAAAVFTTSFVGTGTTNYIDSNW
ncbi:hypothetical protein [Halomonas llamarensis]|uniref:Uncharacterized protein n=1 Tax=Halomonas llamarensis TaxID=2945104 RepID=A0ABT0SUB2_9GAMM|nr:hypothetical protein [Halomonas llamarensis]MCL7930874.1 hypothetical protein [Halomonas llamarensis]